MDILQVVVAIKNKKHYRSIIFILKNTEKKTTKNGTNLGRLNSSRSKNNKSGCKGVYFHSQKNKWVAKLNFQGKSYSKAFSDIDEAIAYRKKLEEKYFKPILDKYNKS